jgi:hypothetical protein
VTDPNAPIGYGAAFDTYHRLGWPAVLPLPRGKKKTPPEGYSGEAGLDPSYADMQTWADNGYADGNLALRTPATIIGIDVDNYGGKNGAATIAHAETSWGRLPLGYRSSGRPDDPVSGIRWFRIPAGVKLKQNIEFRELGLGGVEIIQRHHRYGVVWPSTHPDTGNIYRWYAEIDNSIMDQPPAADDLPCLPDEWIDALRVVETESDGADLGPDGHVDVQRCLTEGAMSSRVAFKLGLALSELYGTTRHDHTRDRVLGLLRCGKNGEPGVKRALNVLCEAFVNRVHKDRPGGRNEAKAEFKSFVYGDKVPELLADEDYDDDENIGSSSDESDSATTKFDDNGRTLRLVPADEIKSDIPDWVWESEDKGRIQRAVLTLFAGRPEAGKSTAVRWFAARWSTGELDGCWKDTLQKIAYIASEEALEYVVKPGLQTAGANMDNFTFPEVKMNGEAVALMSDTDEQELTKQLVAEGVTVVIVDPIMATIRSKVDIYRNNELRQALNPWVRIARRINGTVIGIVHLNKGTSGDVVASVNGSSAFGEVARCVFGFTKDPECEPERVMSQVKNSCGPGDLSLTYEIQAEVFTADTGRQGLIPVFGITGESDTTVGEILAAAGGKRRLSPNMARVVDLVNSRDETHADIVVEKGLAKTRNAATKMLNRLYKRGFIDNPVYGSYCPKMTKCHTS